MYLETYSMEELMELIEEKGYCSVEAVEILKEMEQAKKEYDFLLRDCKEKAWIITGISWKNCGKRCPMMLWEVSTRFRFWYCKSSGNRIL